MSQSCRTNLFDFGFLKASELQDLRKIYEGKRVTCAGGTGMIGRELVSILSQSGAIVHVSGLEDPQTAEQTLPSGTQYTQVDWTDRVRPDLLSNTQFVFNLMGRKGSVGIGERQAASFLMPMLRHQANLIESAYLAGVESFLFVSSLNVYPRAELHVEDNAWNGLPMQNDRIPGIGKRVGEIMGLAFELEHGWDAVKVVRPANVFGPNDVLDPVGSHVIPSLIRKMILDNSGAIEVWGDGSAIRDFIFSRDCAYWIARAAHDLPSNYPVNLGGGRGVTVRELAETIKELLGYKGALNFSAERPSGDPVRILDMTRAREVLGWDVRTPLNDALYETIEWARTSLA
jgi:GDP-L-fucose synthase